ncbi:hypothetical protein DPMN_190278 [Dreissena polymorpha]|uniref:Uncharacterized protein n=1 Tax=Dreissena polymorpha TaxID=45954 RepID=A0A9D4DVW2_DREPO|nr:hypothetical protein DPMN_190278 [Dreissena polymorpha]
MLMVERGDDDSDGDADSIGDNNNRDDDTIYLAMMVMMIVNVDTGVILYGYNADGVMLIVWFDIMLMVWCDSDADIGVDGNASSGVIVKRIMIQADIWSDSDILIIVMLILVNDDIGWIWSESNAIR